MHKTIALQNILRNFKYVILKDYNFEFRWV